MNYTLSINLTGAEDVNASLDSMLSKLGKLTTGDLSNIEIDKLIDASGILKQGEVAGDDFTKGFTKGLKKFSIKPLADDWAKAVFKGNVSDPNKFWNNAIKVGQKPDGFKGYGMADLAKLFNGPQVPDISAMLPGGKDKKIKGLRDVTGTDLAKVNALGSIEEISKGVTKGLREVTGKDLAKVFALPDMNDLTPKMDKLKIAVAGIATLFNPFVGARLLSDVVPKGGMSGGKGVSGAIFGAAGAAGYGEIFVIVKILETAFKILIKAVMNTVAAYETARQIYAKSLMQGLGINFTVKRGMLASILGVSETEVLRFGSAMNYLNPKLAFAAETIAKTTMPLVGVGFEFKILGENIKALWAQIASGLAPAFMQLTVGLNDFLVTLGKSDALTAAAKTVGVLFIAINDVIGLAEIFVNSIVVGFSVIFDSIKLGIQELMNYLSKVLHIKSIGGFDTESTKKHILGSTGALNNEIIDYFKNFLGAKSNVVPNPMAQMKQLPASSWEKMGLVIGGGTNNYAKETAKNTKDIAMGIKTIVGGMKKGSNSGFGYSPNTAQA